MASLRLYLFGQELQIRCETCRGAYWHMNEYSYATSPLTTYSCPRCRWDMHVFDIFAKRRYTR